MLFSADPVTLDYEIYFPPFPSLTNTDKLTIDIIPNNLEIKRALFSMQGLKAPGPDGFQPIFYQKYWNYVGASICTFVKNCFANREFPSNFNNSLITLIPKVDNPESTGKFRPIMLCNVTYKIVTEVLVQRLRHLLDKIVGPYMLVLCGEDKLRIISSSLKRLCTLL